MASKNQSGVTSAVNGGDEGYLLIRSYEDHSLEKLLNLYSATISGYRHTEGDNFTNVTMKISFPQADDINNVNLWAFFIVKAAHATANKPRIEVKASADGGLLAYCTWPIWNEPKFMVSKNAGKARPNDF